MLNFLISGFSSIFYFESLKKKTQLVPKFTFDQIGGLHDAKKFLNQTVDFFNR